MSQLVWVKNDNAPSWVIGEWHLVDSATQQHQVTIRISEFENLWTVSGRNGSIAGQYATEEAARACAEALAVDPFDQSELTRLITSARGASLAAGQAWTDHQALIAQVEASEAKYQVAAKAREEALARLRGFLADPQR
jgi:hypothetical protein